MRLRDLLIYRCNLCGHEWETDKIPTHCPECLEPGPYTLERIGFREV